VTVFTASDHDYPENTPSTVRTITGRYIDLLNPAAGDVHPMDISIALSRVARFGGHTAQPYSVAEHSLVVSSMVARQFGDARLALVGLLHDATEAYIGDMVRPLKRQIPCFREIEDRMAWSIGVSAGLGDDLLTLDPRVKAADEQALVWEMAAIRNASWRAPSDPAVVARAFHAEWRRLATLSQVTVMPTKWSEVQQ
jgi:hypothetical protein